MITRCIRCGNPNQGVAQLCDSCVSEKRADEEARAQRLAERAAESQAAPPEGFAASPGICPNCGNSVSRVANFCAWCRHKLRAVRMAESDYAGFFQRFLARFVDDFIVGIVAGIPAIVLAVVVGVTAYPADDEVFRSQQALTAAQDDAIRAAVVVGILVYALIAILYHTIGNAGGGTWGKGALGIRVRDADDDKTIGFWRSLLRFVVSMIGANFFYLGWLWMIWDDKHQTWHDKAAGSIVVRKD